MPFHGKPEKSRCYRNEHMSKGNVTGSAAEQWLKKEKKFQEKKSRYKIQNLLDTVSYFTKFCQC